LIFKYFLVLLLFVNTLFGCALCSYYTPSGMVSFSLDVQKDKLNTLSLSWHFEAPFTHEVTKLYDTDVNGILDSKELTEVRNALYEYIESTHYLTTLYYRNTHPEFTVSSRYLAFENGRFTFYYTLQLALPFTPDESFGIQVFDEGDYFTFKFDPEGVDAPLDGYTTTHNINANTLFLTFHTPTNTTKTPSNPESNTSQPKTSPSSTKHTTIKTEAPEETTWVADLYRQLTELLRTLKQEFTFGLFMLLMGLSFLYGFAHAAGPGHGKTLVSGYFLSSKRGVLTALVMALLIAFVHTLSAAFLAIFVYESAKLVFGSIAGDAERYALYFSALLVIVMASYLLFQRLKPKPKQRFTLHDPNAHHCGCHSCTTYSKSTDLGVVLAAGLLPCPGTVTLFILTFSLGLYSIGLAAAFAMGLGMGSVIFLSAYLSIKLRGGIEKRFAHLGARMEVLGLLMVLGFGIMLLIVGDGLLP